MSIDTVISELSGKARPVTYTPLWRVCAEWMAVTGLSFGIVLTMYGLRPDLAVRITEPVYIAELVMNLSLILSAGFVATTMAYPDRSRLRHLRYLFAVPLGLYAVIFMIAASKSDSLADAIFHTHTHGFACLQCILVFAVIPAAWMVFRMRTLLVVKPMRAAFLSLMMALASGGLGIRLVEAEPLTAGLMLWHYLPMIGLSLIGLALGRKIFR